jgi:transposase-like protein
VLSYPSGMTVSSRALGVLANALRAHRNQRATRWRKLSAGRQALLVVAYLRKGETYADLACGFGIGTSTVYRYVREAPRAGGRDGSDSGAGDRGRIAQGVRDRRRHPAAHRPRRNGVGP